MNYGKSLSSPEHFTATLIYELYAELIMKIVSYTADKVNCFNNVEKSSRIYARLLNGEFLVVLPIHPDAFSILTDGYSLGEALHVKSIIDRGLKEGRHYDTNIICAREIECEQKRIEGIIKGVRFKMISPSKVRSELLTIIDSGRISVGGAGNTLPSVYGSNKTDPLLFPARKSS